MTGGAAKAARLNALGIAAARAGKSAEAQRSFLAAAAADPANASAYMNLLGCLLPARRYARAAAVCETARRTCNPAQLRALGPALERAAAQAGAGIKKRVLLVSLADTIEHRLFELAFLEAAAGCGSTAVDLAVSPSVFRLTPPPFSFVKRFLCLPGEPCAELSAAGYDAVVFADFPSTAFIEPFCGLLGEPGPVKTFVCLHLLPRKGDCAAADLAAYRRLFSGVKTVFTLDNDEARRLDELGTPRGARRSYPLSVNTGYYAPAGKPGGYLFSAGNSARDYQPLIRAAARLKTELRIYTDLPQPASPGLRLEPLSGNHEALRPALAGAKAVVIPFRPRVSAAANSIATMAMASGKAVLTNDTPALRRLIKPGVTGFLYNERLAGDLDKKLKTLLTLGPAGLERVGRAARKTALAKASSALLAGRVLAELGAD
ncbi:MAG: hypothetical protein HY952_01860 [Elusimicrobia bacterium]|nr:hypothetical protein [Elusimicrobiota bacterium]